MTACDDCFEMGDIVEHRLNSDVFGIVIGFEGSLVVVRLAATLAVVRFHEFEVRLADDDEYHEPAGEEAGNVIDFTKARDLRTAKAQGAA